MRGGRLGWHRCASLDLPLRHLGRGLPAQVAVALDHRLHHRHGNALLLQGDEVIRAQLEGKRRVVDPTDDYVRGYSATEHLHDFGDAGRLPRSSGCACFGRVRLEGGGTESTASTTATIAVPIESEKYLVAFSLKFSFNSLRLFPFVENRTLSARFQICFHRVRRLSCQTRTPEKHQLARATECPPYRRLFSRDDWPALCYIIPSTGDANYKNHRLATPFDANPSKSFNESAPKKTCSTALGEAHSRSCRCRRPVGACAVSCGHRCRHAIPIRQPSRFMTIIRPAPPLPPSPFRPFRASCKSVTATASMD